MYRTVYKMISKVGLISVSVIHTALAIIEDILRLGRTHLLTSPESVKRVCSALFESSCIVNTFANGGKPFSRGLPELYCLSSFLSHFSFRLLVVANPARCLLCMCLHFCNLVMFSHIVLYFQAQNSFDVSVLFSLCQSFLSFYIVTIVIPRVYYAPVSHSVDTSKNFVVDGL